MNCHPQAVLKTGFSLRPDNGVLTWKVVSFFPKILVSLIKEMTSLHRSCFTGGYHCDICRQKTLGIHRSFFLSPSQKDRKEKVRLNPNPLQVLLLCKTAVSGVAVSASDELMGWYIRVQCHAETWPCVPKPPGLQNQHCTGAVTPGLVLEALLVLPLLYCSYQTSAPWVHGGFGKYNLHSQAGENHQVICYKLFAML